MQEEKEHRTAARLRRALAASSLFRRGCSWGPPAAPGGNSPPNLSGLVPGRPASALPGGARPLLAEGPHSAGGGPCPAPASAGWEGGEEGGKKGGMEGGRKEGEREAPLCAGRGSGSQLGAPGSCCRAAPRAVAAPSAAGARLCRGTAELRGGGLGAQPGSTARELRCFLFLIFLFVSFFFFFWLLSFFIHIIFNPPPPFTPRPAPTRLRCVCHQGRMRGSPSSSPGSSGRGGGSRGAAEGRGAGGVLSRTWPRRAAPPQLRHLSPLPLAA